MESTVEIFSVNKVNKGRQKELDYLRGFSALIVIICHVGLFLGNANITGLYIFSDIIGSEWAAPIFMILMGTSLAFSSHNEPKQLFKRGLKLFIYGYIFNFYRSIIPLLIFGNINEWGAIETFFAVDILQFAGLSLMFIALLKKLKLSSLGILIISICMTFLNQLIMLPENIPWNSELITGIVNLFIPTTTWSCFSFLTWFFFPAFGLCFGELLTHCCNKKMLYIVIGVLGFLGVSFVYGEFINLFPNYTNYYFGNNYYFMGVKNVLLTTCFFFFGASFCYFVGNIFPNILKKFLTFISSNINNFYIISWIILCPIITVESLVGFKLDVLGSTACMIIVIILSYVFTYFWKKFKNAVKNHKLYKN